MSAISEAIKYPSVDVDVNGYALTAYIKIHPSDPQFGVPGSDTLMYVFVGDEDITTLVSAFVEDQIYAQIDLLRERANLKVRGQR